MALSLKKLEKQYYQQLYQGKSILIKISGAEICSPDFPKALDDISRLIDNDMKVIVVFGGGEQIDAKYLENTGKSDRPKIDGVAVTTKEILEQGVLPAYYSIASYLQELIVQKGLEEDTWFMPPEELIAKQKSRKWQYTGEVSGIPIDFERSLTFIGFVGSNGKKTYYNVNADEIASFFVKQYNINEVLFITKTGGILNTSGKIVDFISLHGLEKILAGEHKKIKADGGMKKKVLEIEGLLHHVYKVAVIKLTDIMHEITRLEGRGTLCANLQRVDMEQCKDKDLFDMVYAYFTDKGQWKERNEREKREVWKHHQLLSIDGCPLGGYSLLEKPYPLDPSRKGISIECWWAGREKNGIGKLLVEKAILKSALQDMPLFLYTKRDILKISKGFTRHAEMVSETGAELWVREL